MTSIEKKFNLTPRTGDRLADLAAVARASNLLEAVTGYNVMETSLGRIFQSHLTGELTRSSMLASLGRGVVLQDAPAPVGTAVELPATALWLNGELIRLSAQRFDLTSAPAGSYALVLETWVSLVGPTSFGRATEPAIYVGVSDAVNKPSATGLFPAGNVDAVGLVSDAPLVTATVITQKFLQRQYRVRVIAERSLTGYSSDLLGLNESNVPYGSYQPTADPSLHVATLPDNQTARAYDHRFHAVRLATLVRDASSITVLNPSAETPSVVTPAPLAAYVLPSRRVLAEKTSALIQGLRLRVAALEAVQVTAEAKSTTQQSVAPLSLTGSAEPTRVAFAALSASTGFAFDPAYASRVTVNFAGRVRVSASVSLSLAATSAPSGPSSLTLLKNGAVTSYASSSVAVAGPPIPLNLAGEVDVQAGDFLEVSCSFYGAAAGTLGGGAVFSVQRLK